MLNSINITNFKSYEKATLPLAPLTLLIGANASGKSNAIEAIRLMSWLAKGSRLDEIEKDVQKGNTIVRGRARDLFRFKSETFSLGGHLSGAPDSWNNFEITIGRPFEELALTGEKVTKSLEALPLYEIKTEPTQHSDEIRVMYNNFKKGGHKPQIPCSSRQAIFFQLETPGRFGKGHLKSQKIIPAVTKALRQDLRSILFLDPLPSQMRGWSFSSEKEMNEDGSNVSAVLYDLVEEKKQKQAVLDFIQSLPEQEITDIKFIDTSRSEVMVKLEETFGSKSEDLDAGLLSDGTLRVLAIAAALLSAPSGTLVIIEEVDNGVHPSRAKTLIEQIEAVAKKRNLRVLLSTHNPALLNAVPPSALKDVVACFRDPKKGDSRLIRLEALDRYPELVAQGPLGELVTKQILDRFLKDERSPDEVKQASLDWLAAYSDTAKETEK